jgi:hypothetical protein
MPIFKGQRGLFKKQFFKVMNISKTHLSSKEKNAHICHVEM